MRRVMGALAPLMFLASTALAQESLGAGGPVVAGDTITLTLAEAVARAQDSSEEVRLARSQTEVAQAQIRAVRSAAFPHLDGALGYTRTFESQFNSGGGGDTATPDSLKFEPNPNAPLLDRVKYLEDHAATAGLGALGSLFGDLPFGRENAFSFTLTGRQELYTGGRLGAAIKTAGYYKEAAQFQLQEQLADLELNVRTAYFRALLAGELERISAAAVQQADEFLTQERLRERSGSASELDVLRAEVSSANLRPQLIAARNAASLALLDLRRLVNIPADQPVRLATPLEVPSVSAAQEIVSLEALDTRAAVAAAERQVLMRQMAVKIAKSGYFPSANLRVNYGRFLYPLQVFKWGGNDWATDFSATLSIDVPIFNGLRREAEVDQAQVEVVQAQLQLAQLKEGVRLQYEQATGERVRAAAAIQARQQTVNQAQRVYDLTVLRYDRGLATQLEVTDARLALLQSSTNLAQALSDYYIAEATVMRALGRRAGA